MAPNLIAFFVGIGIVIFGAIAWAVKPPVPTEQNTIRAFGIDVTLNTPALAVMALGIVLVLASTSLPGPPPAPPKPIQVPGPQATATSSSGPEQPVPPTQSLNVFQNIILASQNRPLNFGEWPGLLSSQRMTLEKSILLPIPSTALGVMSPQHVPQEIIFYLLIDRVLEDKNQAVTYHVNDPSSPEFAVFQRYVGLFMAYGLRFETKPLKLSGGNQSIDTNNINVRLCFDRPDWAPGTPYAGNRPICGSADSVGNDNEISFKDMRGEVVTLHLTIRSVADVFEYLGRIVALGDKGAIKLHSFAAINWTGTPSESLFRVERSGSAQTCFVYIKANDTPYCIPAAGASNSIKIVEILTQLITLSM